ncbi:hypothetical protein SCHPADRAFT_993568 [Schizopora paradoxa]|uniref:DUF6699 domain-containing protein n=1 Tax=Schizopora paradoxa TaxID=27342 RepID=A0A0H2S1W4_9AGAM|nr:hypothetical protein SCHPADRAFT_993568 [Schizopora paradoxa]
MTAKRVHWGRGPSLPPFMRASPNTPATNGLDDLLSVTDSSAPATPPPLAFASNLPSTNALPKYRHDPRMTRSHTYPYYPYNYSPRLKPSSHLHPSLQYKRQIVPLLWDMSEEPTPQSVRALDGSALDWRCLSTPATDPHCKFMRIQCLGFNFWYPLEFNSRDNIGRPIAISTLDVLVAIYKYLQMPLTPLEYDRLGTMPGLQEEVARAFYGRCSRRPSARLEHTQGLKRIDCLLGNTVFFGLSLESPDLVSGFWQLRVGYSNHWNSTAR